MSDEPRDRDEQWGGADGADEEPEPFVAGVGDRGSAPERGPEPQQEARPHLDEDPADRDRIEIGDDEDFDLAALEAAVAELGIDDEDDAGQSTPAQATRPPASEPHPPQPAAREPESEPESPGSTPEPGLFEQRRQAPPPSTPAPPAAPRSQEPAAPPEPPPAAPPTAMPAAAAEEPEHAESIAALWELASEPTPEEPAEPDVPDVPDDGAPTGEDGPTEESEETVSAEPEPEDEPEVPDPSEVGLDLTNFTAKGGSGAAGASSKRRKGLFRR